MASKQDIGFTMGVDFASFTKGMKAAQQQAEVAAANMKKVLLEAGAVLAVAFGVGKFEKMVVGVMEAGKSLDSLSRQSGIAAGEIGLMTHALDRSGQSIESTTGIMEDMRGKIYELNHGSTEAARTFARLGLSTDDFIGKGLPEQFALIAKKVNELGDANLRTMLSEQALGAAGAKAAANFNSEDITRAAKLFGVSSKAMADASPALAQASDAFKRIQEGGKMFFEIIVSKLAPIFEKVAVTLEEVLPYLEEAADEFGKGLETGVTILVEAFKEGKIGELLSLSLELALMKAADLALGLIKGAIAALGEGLGQAMSIMAEGDFWFGFSDAMIGAFKIAGNTLGKMLLSIFDLPIRSFQAGLQYALEHVIAAFQTDFGKATMKILDAISPVAGAGLRALTQGEGMKVHSYDDLLKQTASVGGIDTTEFDKNIAEGASQIASAGDSLAMAIENSGTSLQAIADAFKQGMDSGGVFGPQADEVMNKLNDLVGGLLKNAEKIPGIGAPPKPGDAGKSDAMFTGNNVFDSLRKVGGGLASGAASVGQRSLDRLTSIDDTMKKVHAVLSKTDTHNEFSGGAARSGFIPVSG